MGGVFVEVGAAGGAETAALLGAENLRGQRQCEGVARPGGEIDDIVLDIRRAQLGGVPRLVDLASVDLDARVGVLEAARARSMQSTAKRSRSAWPVVVRETSRRASAWPPAL